jgi:uncharacterized protein
MIEKTLSPFRFMQQVFSDARPSMQLILIILLMGVFAIIGSFIGMLISVPLYGLSWEQIQLYLDTGFRDADPGLIRFLQAIQTITVFIIPAITSNYFLLKAGNRFSADKLTASILITASVILITFLAAMPFVNSMISLNESIHFPDSWKWIEEKLIMMEEERGVLSERLLSEKSVQSFILNLLAIAILPAIGEEFFFRGILQQILSRWFRNKHAAVLFTAAFFSAFHLQFYGFIPRFLLGAYFGYLFIWAKNIWLPVLAHLLNNALAISLIFIAEGELLKSSWFGEESFSQPIILVISLLLTGSGIWLTYRMLIRRKSYSDTST